MRNRCSCKHSLRLPVSPPIFMVDPDAPSSEPTDSQGKIESPLPAVEPEVVCPPCKDQDEHLLKGDDESVAVPAKGLTDVHQPSAAEIAQHSLTHIPNKRWCKWCVAARMLNVPHQTRPPFSRECPLLVFDY